MVFVWFDFGQLLAAYDEVNLLPAVC